MSLRITVFLLLSTFSNTAAQLTDTSSAGDYLILKKGGQKLFGDVRLFNDPERGPQLIYNGKTEYPVGDAQAFVTQGVYFANLPLVGKKGDQVFFAETLVLRVVQGKIDVYSKYTALDTALKELRYDYFSKGDNAIQSVDYANLKTTLADNLASLKYLRQSRTWSVLRSTLLITGIATTGYGIYKTFRDSREVKTQTIFINGQPQVVEETSFKFKPSPFLYIGFGMSLSSLVPGKIAKTKYKKAIDVYNLP